MPEMVSKLNSKIPVEPKAINLLLDNFAIRFDYDSLSNKSIVAVSHGVSIKMKGQDLTMRLGVKENEILRGLTPIVSRFMFTQLSFRSS